MLHDIARLGGGHERLLAHPLLLLSADAGDQARHRAAEAEISAAHRHRRDRHVLRRDRAECRNRHLAHPDARRARRAIASSSTAARCGTPTPRTPPTSCCWPAPRRVDSAKPFKGLTLFFTEFDRTKITVQVIEKLGRAAVDSNEIYIDGLEVPARGRGRRGGPGLLPPARLAQSRAHLHRHRGRRHRTRGAGPRGGLRQGARRLRSPHRQEPGDRPSAGHGLGQARDRRADVSEGGLALRPRPALRRRVQRRQAAGRRGRLRGLRRRRCRPTAATATPRSSTSSGSGARCGSTRSPRSRSRWC